MVHACPAIDEISTIGRRRRSGIGDVLLHVGGAALGVALGLKAARLTLGGERA